MSLPTPTSTASQIFARVPSILLRPRLEWPVIGAETATIRSVFVPYALVLSAIGPMASLIGGQLSTFGVMGFVYRPNILMAMVLALVSWGLALAMAYGVTLVIEALATSFGGLKDRNRAAKVAVYASTALWVAGIFNLFPPLAWLGSLLGLYSIYLLYLGLQEVVKATGDKAILFTLVVVVIVLVFNLIAGTLMAGISLSAMATNANSLPFVY